MQRPTVYLAGPISACNHEQRHAWRNEIKHGFAEEFNFIDPAENLIDSGSDFDVVSADAEAIRGADAVLANMWKESIGTSFGVLHGHLAGKIVCVCDPNHIGSRMLAFYADSVERHLGAALNSIRVFLRSQRLIVGVTKRNGEEEPFDRHKLSLSVRKACIEAGTGDIVPTRAIVSRTLRLLFEDAYDERRISTEELRELVWQAIAELAADPSNEEDFERIRLAWEGQPAKEPAATAGGVPVGPSIQPEPQLIPVRTQGTHSTIWGHLHQMDARARVIFDEMRRVDGLTEIVLGPFQNTGSPPSRPHVRLLASKTPHLIEGKMYSQGKKGTLQTFQIRLADPRLRDATLVVLRGHLLSLGYIRSGGPETELFGAAMQADRA